jgi:hypothetical protein
MVNGQSYNEHIFVELIFEDFLIYGFSVTNMLAQSDVLTFSLVLLVLNCILNHYTFQYFHLNLNRTRGFWRRKFHWKN